MYWCWKPFVTLITMCKFNLCEKWLCIFSLNLQNSLIKYVLRSLWQKCNIAFHLIKALLNKKWISKKSTMMCSIVRVQSKKLISNGVTNTTHTSQYPISGSSHIQYFFAWLIETFPLIIQSAKDHISHFYMIQGVILFIFLTFIVSNKLNHISFQSFFLMQDILHPWIKEIHNTKVFWQMNLAAKKSPALL